MPPEPAPTGNVLTLALDPSVAPPDDATSERILDAALALIAEGGIRAVTMDAVPARAGVGRMTVYRRFGDRAGLVQALTVRETRRALDAIAGTPAVAAGNAEDGIAEGFATAIGIARDHPLFSRLPPLEVIGGLNSPHDATAELLRGFLAGQIRDWQDQGQLREVDPEQAAELLLRIGASFLLIPRSVIPLDGPDAARRFARDLIAPILAK